MPDFRKAALAAAIPALMSVTASPAQANHDGNRFTGLALTSTVSRPAVQAPREAPTPVRATRIVRGSWVCSPSGFGRRPRCSAS